MMSIMEKTPNEAQIQLSQDLRDILIDLAIDDDDVSEAEAEEIEESMDEIVGTIFQAFELKVLSVEGTKLTCEVNLLPDLEEG
jgi:hypothetical protein